MNFLKFLFIAGFFFFASPLLVAEAAAPGLPTGLACDNAAATLSSIKATWTAVIDTSSYKYKIGSAGTLKSATETSASIGGLESGREYNIRVQACNGASECSGFAEINCSTNPAKPKVTSLKTSDSITLNWDSITGATLYQVGYKATATSTYTYREIAQGTYTTTLGSLVSNTSYSIKIQACNGNKINSDTELGYDVGCSGFVSSNVTTPEVQDIANLKDSYKNKNLQIQKTLNGYKDYIAKNKKLETATLTDFNNEVTPILTPLAAELTSVQSGTDPAVITNKIAALDSIQKTQVELLKYKLKIYTKCNGYYEKFESYRTKAGGFSDLLIPAAAKAEFNGSGKHIDKAISYYRDNFEKKILSSKLSTANITNATNNLTVIKSLYGSLEKDDQYKLTKLVYESLYYVNNVNGKLIKFKEYSNNTNKKYLSKVFAAATIMAGYNTIIDGSVVLYNGYIGGKPWNDYATVSNDNSSLKKDGRYKQVAVILKGLSNINSIIAKTEDYKTGIDGFFSATLKTKAGAIKDKIMEELRDGSDPLGKKIVVLTNDSQAIYKQINGYSGHKVFSYLYNGSKSLNSLNANLNNIKNVATTMTCTAASASITASEGKIAAAVAKLDSISLSPFNLDSTKQKYSEFKILYQEALNSYKMAISEVKGCL
ncbi:MAG: fibronectin type III domain-containing protein [Patescibacteria group bacterium]